MSAEIIRFPCAPSLAPQYPMTDDDGQSAPLFIDLDKVSLAAFIESDGTDCRLFVHASIPGGSCAIVFEGRFSRFARALAFAIWEFGITDPLDCRGPDGEGYFG